MLLPLIRKVRTGASEHVQVSMSLTSLAVLFGSMAALAAAPSVSVLTVSARSASLGLRHGVLTTLGILAGDILFILLALFGLSILAELLGSRLYLIGYAAGAYMIILGARLWTATRPRHVHEATRTSLLSSFWTGLLITLADQKAVLFYLGFFPAFLDLSQVHAGDVALILAITVIAVGGAKLAYAILAVRVGALLGPSSGNVLSNAAAAIMIAVGIYLLWTTYLSR